LIVPLLRYYMTGHGLGHASRSCQVLQALHTRHPAIGREVVTDAAPWFLAANLPPATPVYPRTFDIGVRQGDSLEMHLAATVAAWDRLLSAAPALLAAERDDLRRAGVDLVVTDVAALPCAAAAAAGIPAVILSNFTWDWIYEGFLDEEPGFAAAIAWQRDCYRMARLGLRLPFPGPLPVAETVDLPLVTRRSRTPRETVRQQLGVGEGERLALLSFGGFGLEEVSLERLAELDDWVLLAEDPLVAINPRLRPLPPGIAYPDLVNAADAVVTKPGYGIVAECLAHRTPVLFTPRGNFREQPLLVAGLQRYGRAVEISNQRLRRGDLREPLEQLLALPQPVATLAANGADMAADQLARLLT
jgi:L-arabinokinase